MNQRQVRLVLMFLGVCFAFAPPAQAQRSGFIIGIGIGLGPGYTSYSAVPDRVSKTGVAFDFHIGGVVDEFELFYAAKANIFGSDVSAIDQLASGVNVIGFAYPLTPEFSITGGIGLGVWVESRSSVTTNDSDGIGLLGGGRYQLGDSGRWMLNFDMMYGKPMTNLNAFGAQVTINVVSH